ncbi:MAG: hypothetical protein KY455_02540 [Euryarchaeota archaeon]|nr:hypothetical protein [Euryarchaeota archaeon]
MQWSLRAVVLSLLLVTFAGCIGTTEPPGDEASPFLKEDGSIDHDAVAALIGAPIEVEHDHRAPTEPDHNGGVNLELVSWNTLGIKLGEQGFANFVFHEDDDEDLAFVAVDGDTTAGFVIADVSDPANVTVLDSYMMVGNSVQEVRVTADGRYALMNVQDLPGAETAVGTAEGQGCTICLHLFDVSDRTDVRWLDALPVDNIGTHNMHVHTVGDTEYVFYVGQPASYNFPTNLPGNYIGIAEIVTTPTGAKLVKVGEWRDPAVAKIDAGRSFPHDVLVYDHPLTGKPVGYLSYWDGGAVTVDFSDVRNPVTLDVDRTMDGSGALAIHWFMPEPEARADGRVIAWSAPEIGSLESDSGVVRAYDVTDPADIKHLGVWGVPGEMSIPGKYVFSGHTTMPDMERGLLAVSHYHAGVWVLDVTDPAAPKHLAYYMTNGNATHTYDGDIWWKKPNFSPDGFGPNVYQARWKDGQLFVTDRGTGLYVLDYTGPIPGSVLGQ